MPQDQKPSTAKLKDVKSKLHHRNRHQTNYNFEKLIAQTPALADHVATNKYGVKTIDFHSTTAVKLLNQALLKYDYEVLHWDIPDGYLYPPIPSRADYIHYAADILGSDDNRRIPLGKQIKCLDIGTGANCIYPIIGASQYEWSWVASDIDPISVQTANTTTQANGLAVEVRLQENDRYFFKEIIKAREYYDISVCNPPTHGSQAEATSAILRKLKNRKSEESEKSDPSFHGLHKELWCSGGELRFIKDMVRESAAFKEQVLWFSTLVNKPENLDDIYFALKKAEVVNVKTMAMGKSTKSSSIVAWTFHTKGRRMQWAKKRTSR
jgi:23S rRNA (adenine1618-N6)-methyltransferase